MSGGSIENIPYFLGDDLLDEVKTHFKETSDKKGKEEVWMYAHKIAYDVESITKLIKSLDYYISGDTSVEEFLKAAKERYKE